MSYRYNVAITTLQKDWDELREFVKSIKDEYTQGEFNFDSESPSEVRGIKAITLFRDDCYWRPETEDAWAGILMHFLIGDKENDYDDGQRLKMRYIDGVVGVAVMGYAGLSESTIERMETELTHIMNRIGEHAQRAAQGAINHYFSDEEVSRWLAHNDLECYSDGMIAEEEV